MYEWITMSMFDNNARKQTSEMAVGAQYRHNYMFRRIDCHSRRVHGVKYLYRLLINVIIQKLAKLFVWFNISARPEVEIRP